MKEGACMPIMITRKGQRHARAIHRKECTNRGRREWKVVRYYVKCAPPNETKKEFVSSAHSRTLTDIKIKLMPPIIVLNYYLNLLFKLLFKLSSI